VKTIGRVSRNLDGGRHLRHLYAKTDCFCHVNDGVASLGWACSLEAMSKTDIRF
jgi:hypothetical protein